MQRKKFASSFCCSSCHKLSLNEQVSEQQMTLLLLHFPPQHYYPPAAPPPVTANVFERENLWGNKVLRPIAT